MALVMLPCDLPWWPVIQRHLTQLALARTPQELTDGMQKIHNMCNIGLDPDEEKPEEPIFANLHTFMERDMSPEEQSFLLGSTVPSMVQRALQLKQLKPASGLRFSLQQQADKVELDRRFVASMLAHSFFSTFPKRTLKTHPTLQDSNFTNFFIHLDKTPQKAKLRSILAYFDRMDGPDAPAGTITFSRQVMTGKEWLTVEDWLEMETPLTAVSVRHEGRLDRVDVDAGAALRVCFVSSHLGGDVLAQGTSQECVQFCTAPELLTLLPWVEALEDNEVMLADGVLQVARIADPRNRADFESTARSTLLRVCCMDAEDYRKLPLGQLEEDNVLRELNKALLGFRQHAPSAPPPRRLSPIGESCGSTPPENRKESLRQRFIVLGSSGERLPVSRRPGPRPASSGSHYSSCRSTSASTDDFVSARASMDDVEEEDDDEDDEGEGEAGLLDTPERRHTFAARLRDALRLAREAEGSEDSSSYAVGISVAGSGVRDADGGCRVRRGGSGGFVLREDSADERLQEVSSEYSSDLEELCSRYSRWLEDLEGRELDARDVAVVRFAGSLLKRTLSDSFAGAALGEDGPQAQVRVVARSLSLELARRKNRLAALLQLQQERHAPSVVTGNWGCGAARAGDPQLKMVLQWLAASAAGAATLVYYTCGHPHLLKLDTVVRVLLDRRWSVGELAGAALRHTRATLEDPAPLDPCWLFNALIGVQRETQ